ncbi:hypothetical protein HanIR_Chr14g0726681 [Helianthus annuus]|nr:hypothetical protein HanIR_Chr14g0726681 [Helianthus annuus]
MGRKIHLKLNCLTDGSKWVGLIIGQHLLYTLFFYIFCKSCDSTFNEAYIFCKSCDSPFNEARKIHEQNKNDARIIDFSYEGKTDLGSYNLVRPLILLKLIKCYSVTS